MGTYIKGLITPLTVAASAAAAVGYSFMSAKSVQEGYAKALIRKRAAKSG